MKNEVKKFKLFGEEIEIKDEFARGKVNKLYNTKRYGIYKRIVINGNDVSDFTNGVIKNTQTVSNNSGTLSDAYLSLDYAMEILNQGETHLKIYIQSSGVYVIKKPVISDVYLHIQVQADNVTIVLDSSNSFDDRFDIYNSMVRIYADDNVSRLTLKTTNADNTLQFEQCGLLLRNVNYDGGLLMYSCYIQAFYGTIGRVECCGCNGHIFEFGITNKDSDKFGLYFSRGCHMELGGATADFIDSNGNGGSGRAMVGVSYSTLNLLFAQNTSTNYKYGIYCVGSTLFCTQARINTYSQNALVGNYFEKSIVIRDDNLLH